MKMKISKETILEHYIGCAKPNATLTHKKKCFIYLTSSFNLIFFLVSQIQLQSKSKKKNPIKQYFFLLCLFQE